MKNLFVPLILMGTGVYVGSMQASAAPITEPTGLSPGDSYRLVFVTRAERDASSANIEDYNTFVTNYANSIPELAALETTWSAIASTPSVDARDNTDTHPSLTGFPIYKLDGSSVADNNADLWDGELDSRLDVDGHGEMVPLTFVWTGTDDFGRGIQLTFPGPQVIGYELGNTNTVNATYGNTYGRDTPWILANNREQSRLGSFYAMSGVLTVVPEPSSLVLFTFGLLTLVVFGSHYRCKRLNCD